MPKFIQIIVMVLAISFTAKGQQQFIENKGQWKNDFDYKFVFGNGSVFLNQTSITVHLVHPDDLSGGHHGFTQVKGQAADLSATRHHAYRVHFVGADPNCDISTGGQLETYHNYILGSDRQSWRKRVPLFEEVTYHNIYPNIDLRYYFSPEGNLKYDFIVNPGGDPSQIKLRYEGADDLELVYGNLMVRTSVDDVLESAPYAYQLGKGNKNKVRCNYVLDGEEVTFELNNYSKKQTLVIDPKLVFSSYTGSDADNFGFTATHSQDGSLYAGGVVFLHTGTYPVTVGAYRIVEQGGYTDIGISKFSSDGSQLIYSTYLGGSGDEIPFSLFERDDGSLAILGCTGSLNYPTSINAYQDTLQTGVAGPSYFSNKNLISFPDGVDAVVTILDSSGGELSASTYFGGSWQDGLNIDLDYNYGDNFRGEVIADGEDNVYIVSSTFSNNLPTTPNAMKTIWGGRQDGFACSFSPTLNNLRWSTFVGGPEVDNVLSIKMGKDNNVFIAGGTQSPELSMGPGAFRDSGIGETDGYIISLKNDDGSFVAGTYNGTDERDMNFFVEVDDSGDVYVMGQTLGLYPADTNSLYSNPGSSQYINKFSSDLKHSLRAMVFGDSSHSKSNISPTAFMVDNCRNVFVSGWGGGENVNAKNQGQTFNLPLTKNALQLDTDGSDFYFFVLDASWKRLNYATYFGGLNTDHVDGGTSRFAKDGTIYQAVCGGCGGKTAPPFPTTAGAYSRSKGAENCNLAALKIDFEALQVVAEIDVDRDSSCIPFTANFTNLSYNADKFIWITPSGSSVSNLNSVLVDQKGSHVYTLIAIDTTCGFRDTTEVRLHGFRDTVHAAFELEYDSCSNNFQVKTINTSLDADYYFWDFGDGKSSSLKNPLHGYAKEGTYTVKLVTRNSYCQLADSLSMQVKFKKRVNSPDFNIKYEPCLNGGKPTFKAIGTGFQEYRWDFGDGKTGSGSVVSHDFTKSGNYSVKLTLRDTLCGRFQEKDTTLEIYTADYEPQFPNVFTPNGDGLNEHFGLSPKIPRDFFSEFHMKIYNRWGTLLYRTDKTDQPWNGTFENNKMADGVYFYIINLKDGCNNEKEYTGFVHLLNS